LFHFQSSNTPKFERVALRVHEGWILTVPPSNSPRQLPVPAVCAAPANSAVKLKRRSSTVTVVGQFDDLWSGFRTSARGNRVSSTPAISSTMVPCMLPATPIAKESDRRRSCCESFTSEKEASQVLSRPTRSRRRKNAPKVGGEEEIGREVATEERSHAKEDGQSTLAGIRQTPRRCRRWRQRFACSISRSASVA